VSSAHGDVVEKIAAVGRGVGVDEGDRGRGTSGVNRRRKLLPAEGRVIILVRRDGHHGTVDQNIDGAAGAVAAARIGDVSHPEGQAVYVPAS
jgi:hypothetical protein